MSLLAEVLSAYRAGSLAEARIKLRNLTPDERLRVLAVVLAEPCAHRWVRDPETEAHLSVDIAWRCRQCGSPHPNTVTTRWTYVPDEEAAP